MTKVIISNDVSELLKKTKRDFLKSNRIASEVSRYLSLIKLEGDDGILKLAKKFDSFDAIEKKTFKLDLNKIDSKVTEVFKRSYFRAKKHTKIS